MGMFDSVHAKCPNCKHTIEFQSKAGDCVLEDHPIDNVPTEIAKDIEGEQKRCPNCDIRVIVEILPKQITTVSMYVREI